MKIVINGDFLMHRTTGVQRYALEVTKELDQILYRNNNQVELLVPSDCMIRQELNNIKIVRYGKYKRVFWVQHDLMHYCRKKKAICLCMATLVPYFYASHSVNVIHDAGTLVHPEFYCWQYILESKLFQWRIVNKIRNIITVSYFSKSELERYAVINSQKIAVAYNAYEHMNDVQSDYSIFDKLHITPKGYFYSLSSLSPNKNFQWILNEARNNPGEIFVISGMKIDLFSDSDLGDNPDNVIFTGYLRDEEVKALMSECKTFLFPTLYEGFGIPPLEALSCGAKITVSDIPIMHEVYEECANYIDPNDSTYNAEELIGERYDVERILKKYSWRRTAEIIWNAIKENGEREKE